MTAKGALRRTIRARLKALDPPQRLGRSQRAIDRLLATREYRDAKTVAAYASFGFEFPMNAFLQACLRDGKTLGLPATEADFSMSMHTVGDLSTDLEQNAFGFQQPLSSRPQIAIEQIGLLVVPGIAYDIKGGRLGRGAGFYDRFLARDGLTATICALAFECQIVDAIILDAHDRPVDMILTEDRTIPVRGELT